MTAKKIHFAVLDGWRALACLLVVFHHTGYTLGWDPIWLWGYCGVHAFFVLSGFLLFLPFCEALAGFRDFPSIKNFYIRRAARILPAYLLALTISSLLRAAANANPPSVTSFVTHALLIFNWGDRSEVFAINAVFWTLAIEAQFYVILPLASWAAHRGFAKRSAYAVMSVVLLFFVVGILSRGYEYLTTSTFNSDPIFRYTTSYLDLFACGMFVCLLYVQRRHRTERTASRPYLVLAVGSVLVLVANYWSTRVAPHGWMVTEDFVYTLAFAPLLCIGLAACLWAGVVDRSIFSRLLALPWLAFIGKISYSIYLFHVLVQIPMFRLIPLHFLPDTLFKNFSWGLISLGPTLCIAYIVYRFVEEPAIRYAAALTGREMPAVVELRPRTDAV